MKKILITGASGFIGSHMVTQALNLGYEVYAAVRSTSKKDFIQFPEVKLLEVDFENAKELSALLAVAPRFDYIIHGAGITKAKRNQEYYHVNFGLTRRLITALQSSGNHPEKFIYISSQAALGPNLHGNYKSGGPVSDYGNSKLQTERFLITLKNFPWIIVQPAAVFGPHDKGFLELFRILKFGIEPYIGHKEQQLNLIYVKDLARGVMEIVDRSDTQKEYFISDGKIYFSSQFNREALRAMNAKSISLKLPLGLMKFIARCNEAITAITGKPMMLNRQRLREFSAKSWIGDHKPFFKEINFTPQYDLESGMKETIAWYKTVGWI